MERLLDELLAPPFERYTNIRVYTRCVQVGSLNFLALFRLSAKRCRAEEGAYHAVLSHLPGDRASLDPSALDLHGYEISFHLDPLSHITRTPEGCMILTTCFFHHATSFDIRKHSSISALQIA